MQKLYISPTSISPEIHFSPEEDIYFIRGTSSPEDVRALYYPVTEWISELVQEIITGKIKKYSAGNPLVFKADMKYFNSSSAKFLYDIFIELKKLISADIPVVIEWYHEEEDLDLKEAGSDIALLAEMEFTFIPKS
jgi:hypothetical protein